MFATPALAARIDRADARLCAEVAALVAQGTHSEPIAGGLAVFAGPGSPFNKLIGAGFDAPADEAALARIEARFAERGAPLQAEIATLADPEIHALFVRRGYRPSGFENVLGHPLRDLPGVPPVGIAIEEPSPAGLAEWTDTVLTSALHPDQGGIGGDATVHDAGLRRWIELVARTSGCRVWLARIGGAPAGGASMRIDDRIAQLNGAATLPAFRRRGVQTALLVARLREAARAGCELAVVTTQPASRSQHNVQRQGFALLYSRALLVKSA